MLGTRVTFVVSDSAASFDCVVNSQKLRKVSCWETVNFVQN